MSKLKFQVSEEGVHTSYLQNQSAVIVRMSHISQTNLPQAQTGLLLDFNIRDSVEEQKKWSGFQHTLKQIFNSVVLITMIRNCQLKINIFVLIAGFDIQSTIINAVQASLLKLAIPMNYSVCAIAYPVSQSDNSNPNERNNIVVNISNNNQIIFGKCVNQLSENQIKFADDFKCLVIQSLNQCIKK